MLIDSFSRRFTYLRLSITENCNFRCSYCLPNGSECHSRKGEITLPEIKRLVTAFARLGTTKVRITGGEPSLRKDLCDIITTCKSVPGIQKVALTTNGYRLKRDISNWKDAGLDAINVSIDSLDANTFHLITGQDRLQEILQGIDMAIEQGINQVKINTVLLRQNNAHLLTDFLAFVKARSISLRFIELMQTGDNQAFYQHQHLSGMRIQHQLIEQGWNLQPKGMSDGPALEYAHQDYVGKIGLIMPYSKDFCADCNRLRVSSQAKLFLCLFSDAHQDLRHLLQDNDHTGLMYFLQNTVMGKAASHQLHQSQTGSTRQLAMIGG